MSIKILNIETGKSENLKLSDSLIGLKVNNKLLKYVIDWQLNHAKRRLAKTKQRNEIKGSTRKIYAQKGTGGARHGARSAPIFRGGGVYKGPVPRSHGHELPKRVRKMGLKMAISAKAKSGSLVIIDDVSSDGKTSSLAKQIKSLGWKRVLIIDGQQVNVEFAQAARNIDGLDILPSMGANVFDILKRDTLVITKAGVEALEARLK